MEFTNTTYAILILLVLIVIWYFWYNRSSTDAQKNLLAGAYNVGVAHGMRQAGQVPQS